MSVMNTALPNKLVESLASLLVVALCISLLTSTALTNICVFLMILLSLYAWLHFQWQPDEWSLIKPLFLFIGGFCLWDLFANLISGNGLADSFQATRHVRKFFFVIVLWPLFVMPRVARHAVFALGSTVALLAGANLVWIFLLHGEGLMTSFMPNLHGQILVGTVLLLVHAFVFKRQQSMLLLGLVLLLSASLFWGSDRRTGYVLLIVGSVLLFILVYQHQSGRRRIFFMLGGLVLLAGLVFFASLSAKVQARAFLFVTEYHEFLQMSTIERSRIETSVGLRLQYFISAWKIIQDHFWLGTGSLNFKQVFWEINKEMGATNPIVFAPNPHNEYLYTWATKGLIGLLMYLGIFFQACQIARQRTDIWQRHGLWLLVALFLTSIFFNSMSIDMVEGHFMMLIMLILLAPRHIFDHPQPPKASLFA